MQFTSTSTDLAILLKFRLPSQKILLNFILPKTITMIENLQGETRKLCDTCLYQASRAITSNDLRTTYLNYHESATQLLEKLAGLLKLQNEVVKAVSYRSLQFEFRNLVSIEQVNNTLAKWRSMAELAKQCQSEEMLGAISLRLEILEQMLEKLQA